MRSTAGCSEVSYLCVIVLLKSHRNSHFISNSHRDIFLQLVSVFGLCCLPDWVVSVCLYPGSLVPVLGLTWISYPLCDFPEYLYIVLYCTCIRRLHFFRRSRDGWLSVRKGDRRQKKKKITINSKIQKLCANLMHGTRSHSFMEGRLPRRFPYP